MSAIVKLIRGKNWRWGLMRFSGWLHCTLIFAVFFAGIVRIVRGEEVLWGSYLRGLLYIIPLALADIAGEKVPALWQYLLVSIAICAVTWGLIGTPFGIIPVGVVCFFRGKNRLSEEPVDSIFDKPVIPGVAAFLIPFIYSAISGGPSLQKLTFINMALYLLLCIAYRGVYRIEEYLELNRDMAGLPKRRIMLTSGLALLAALTIAAALFLPALFMETGYIKIEPTQQNKAATAQQEITGLGGGSQMGVPEELAAMAEGKSLQIPPFVSYIIYAVILGVVLVIVVYGVLCLVRSFRSSFTDHRDVVQYLRAEEIKERIPIGAKKKISAWDRSPNAIVRRKYKKAVLKSLRESPERWRTPEEIEEKAGLENPELHHIYEKARYSKQGCSARESRSF